MFERLRFYSNGFPLWCNVFIRFRGTMVLLMTTIRSRVHYQTSFLAYKVSTASSLKMIIHFFSSVSYACSFVLVGLKTKIKIIIPGRCL